MEAGLVEEVKNLQLYQHLNALQTVGYSEIFDYFEWKNIFSRSDIEISKQIPGNMPNGR